MREPSFLIIANPVQKYHPMQMNFLGKDFDRDMDNLLWLKLLLFKIRK